MFLCWFVQYELSRGSKALDTFKLIQTVYSSWRKIFFWHEHITMCIFHFGPSSLTFIQSKSRYNSTRAPTDARIRRMRDWKHQYTSQIYLFCVLYNRHSHVLAWRYKNRSKTELVWIRQCWLVGSFVRS